MKLSVASAKIAVISSGVIVRAAQVSEGCCGGAATYRIFPKASWYVEERLMSVKGTN